MTDFEFPTSSCPLVLANDTNYLANSDQACAGNPTTVLYVPINPVKLDKVKVKIK